LVGESDKGDGATDAGRHGRRARQWRFSAVAADQVLAGSSNVLIAILAARTLDVTGFGEFGIVFLVFVVAQSVPRALVGLPLLVHPEEADEDPGEALGSGIAVGLAIGPLIALAGVGTVIWSSEDLGRALVILGVLFPLLVLQDVGRYVAFATRRPVAAMHLDLVWLVVMVAAIVGAASLTSLALPGLVLGWLGGGSVGGLMALWQHRAHRVRISLSWVRTCWMFSWRYLVSAATKQGAVLIATLILAALAGVAAVGAVQGATLALRPFATAQIAAVTAGTAEVARDLPRSRALRGFAVRLSALLTGFAFVNAAVLLVLPTALGELFLGDTWPATKELLVPAGISVLVMGAWTGAWAGLLGDRAIRKTLALDLSLAPIVVAMSSAGAAIDGATGYYWGVAAGQALVALAWWVCFMRHTRTDPRDTSSSGRKPSLTPGGLQADG
jgi:hypothetical protein